MLPLCTRRRFLAGLADSLTTVGTTGCGTILYPERRGQPAGDIDWKIVALDALGLLLFFVPGVIAFAVDFGTGAIYLPRRVYSQVEGERPELATIEVPREELSQANVARIVSERTGHAVALRPGEYESEPLASIDEFWSTRQWLAERT